MCDFVYNNVVLEKGVDLGGEGVRMFIRRAMGHQLN